MAVRDEVPLKYWFPKLDFNVRPGTNQKYVVKYTTYSENYENNNWVTLSSNCQIQPDGTPVRNLEIIGLRPFTEYVIRFTNILGENFDFKFKTGKNIAMTDSPYYNKTLFPGQIYDWYEAGLHLVGQPNTDDCAFCYWLNSKKREMMFEEEWGSMSFVKETNGKYVQTSEDGNFETAKDKNGTSIMGFSPIAWDTGENQLMVLPCLKFNDTTNQFEPFGAYWTEHGGGGVTLDDVYKHSYAIGFAFYLKEPEEGQTYGERVLCSFDTSKNPTERFQNNYSFRLYVNTNKTLIADISGTSPVSLGTNLENNIWYYCILSATGLNIYYMKKIGENTSYENLSMRYTMPKLPDTGTGHSGFYFGGTPKDGNIANTGFIIAYVCCGVMINPEQAIYEKVLNPDVFQCRLRLSGTNKNGVAWTYLQPTSFNAVATNEKVSFLIDPDIFANIPELSNHKFTETGIIKAEIVSNNKTLFTKNFPGFSYPVIESGTQVNVGGIIPNKNYLQESFDIDFTKTDNPLKALQEYFFTKHGTWGGYNGGVNGHNIYFDENQNIVLENHGDYYKGSLMGVGKESDVKPYCGYGGDVDYDNNAWDNRTNKSRLRTGTALVSNKYFGYGRIDVWLQLPVGIWGVCPAIWLFHYIEVSDTDYRYKQAPYKYRNAQGSDEAGWYRVVNNEIDIELPSHLTNGTLSSWSDLQRAYFDNVCIDNKLSIGVTNGSDDEKGLFQLIDVDNPKERISWRKIDDVANPRYLPSFKNCKFNNWVGELNSGNGWCLPQGEYSAESYYTGNINGEPDENLQKTKEEYCSQLTHVADNEHGFADGKFHKWSIVWLPDRTILYVDDVCYRENKGFVPFNQMKLTIAGWFPTMPKNKKEHPTGVVDSDGIHGTKGGLIDNLTDDENTSIGTWAGTVADFEILHMKISRVKYEKYHAGETIEINGKSTKIETEPTCLGESFPESGLRMFVE